MDKKERSTLLNALRKYKSQWEERHSIGYNDLLIKQGIKADHEATIERCNSLIERFEHPASPGSGWRPIESAPTDGRLIDVWVMNDENTGFRVLEVKWRESDGSPEWIYYDKDYKWVSFFNPDGHLYGYEPTYWQPLPAAPGEGVECDLCMGVGKIMRVYDEGHARPLPCPECKGNKKLGAGVEGDYLLMRIDKCVGNSALFWRPEGKGYTLDINQAGRYEKEEAEEHVDNRLLMVPVSTAYRISQPHADMCRLRNAVTNHSEEANEIHRK